MSTNLKLITIAMIAVFTLAVTTAFTAADELENNRKALEIISNFADRHCREAPIMGTQKSTEIEGEMRANLNSLISKITDLGVKGASRYKTSEYVGILQQDLSSAIRDANNCRIQVLNILSEKLLEKRVKPSLKTTVAQKTAIKKKSKPNAKMEQADAMKKLEESLYSDIDFFNKNLAGVDLNNECRNKVEYMEKYHQAIALLDTIEAKAKKTENKEILETFVHPRRHGMHMIRYNCP